MSSPTAEPVCFEGVDGVTLSADAWGNRNHQPVLLLHGGGQTRHAWDGAAAALAERGYRAIAVDARGHGQSDWSADGHYSLELFGRDLKCITQQLQRPAALVGASLGGSSVMIAVGALGVEPPAVVLVDIAPQIEPAGVERIFRFMCASPNGFASIEQAADAVADYLPHRKRPEDLSGLRKNLRLHQDGRYRWHWDPGFVTSMRARKLERRQEKVEQVALGLDCPTLLVRGKLSDLLSEEGAQRFLELVPHAEYVDVSGAAHMVAGDRNDRFTEAVVDFLDRKLGPTSNDAEGRSQIAEDSPT